MRPWAGLSEQAALRSILTDSLHSAQKSTARVQPSSLSTYRLGKARQRKRINCLFGNQFSINSRSRRNQKSLAFSLYAFRNLRLYKTPFHCLEHFLPFLAPNTTPGCFKHRTKLRRQLRSMVTTRAIVGELCLRSFMHIFYEMLASPYNRSLTAATAHLQPKGRKVTQ